MRDAEFGGSLPESVGENLHQNSLFRDSPSLQKRYVLSFMYETYLRREHGDAVARIRLGQHPTHLGVLLWFGIGIVVGGIMLAHDEWRLHRTRPKPEEVQAHADRLLERHGQEAFRINGDAMIAVRSAREFDRYRFLKEVSGELVRRLLGPNPADDPSSKGTQEFRERAENA